MTDLDDAIATYETLFGAKLEHRQPLVEQGVEAASVLVGESRFELVTPTGDDTPVGRFLARRGPGMHHVALEAEDLYATLEELESAGAHLIDRSAAGAVRPRGRVRPSGFRPRRSHGGGWEWLTTSYGSRSDSTAGRS